MKKTTVGYESWKGPNTLGIATICRVGADASHVEPGCAYGHLHFDQFSRLYRVMLSIRGTSHGPVSVCVCLSVTSRSSIETDERIGLVLGMGASFHPSYTVL